MINMLQPETAGIGQSDCKWLGRGAIGSYITKHSQPQCFGPVCVIETPSDLRKSPLESIKIIRTSITLGGAVIKSILRIPHRKFEELFGRQVFRFHGAEVEQMAAGSDDEGLGVGRGRA